MRKGTKIGLWVFGGLVLIGAMSDDEDTENTVDTSEPVPVTEDTIPVEIQHNLAFQSMWDTRSEEEKSLICEGFLTFGPEVTYESFIRGYSDNPPSLSQFQEFFGRKC